MQLLLLLHVLSSFEKINFSLISNTKNAIIHFNNKLPVTKATDAIIGTIVEYSNFNHIVWGENI